MTRVAWWHCFAGIAGDMALASLVDAGADLDEVCAILRGLPIGGWSVEARPVLRAGVAATALTVEAPETGVVRTHAHIVGVLTEGRLPERARRRALAVFDALATVEGRLHRRPPAQVHFHELGGVDALVDIVGTCVALELLEVDRVTASPVATGLGMVRSAHGLLPNPAPAVVALLAGAPTYGRDVPVELTTPTGAALLRALGESFGPLPAMTVRATGFGAGSRDLDALPNVTQVVLGEATEADGPRPAGGQEAVLIETNLDDATGETLASTLSLLLEAGAHDAWIEPIVGKKGRPAHVLAALAEPALAGPLAELMAAETGSLGVRGSTVTRWPARRRLTEVEVEGLPVRVKISPGRVKAEHDDAVRVGRHLGWPARVVAARAEQQADSLPEPPPPAG